MIPPESPDPASQIGRAVSNLWAWLNTWLDDEGGIHGYIVHHHRDNLKVLCSDTWTQAPALLGCLALYDRTQEPIWLSRAKKLGNFLVETYLPEAHLFANSNHEAKPLGSPGLIHNALASLSLARLAQVLKAEGEPFDKCTIVAQDNLDNFILANWDPSVGAILSSSDSSRIHIHNMNSATIMLLVSLEKLGVNKSLNHAVAISRYVISCQIHSGQLKGAYPYRDHKPPFVTLYSLITALGLLDLYGRVNREELLHSVRDVYLQTQKCLSPLTGLVGHYHSSDCPNWVPDTFLLILLTSRLASLGEVTPDLSGALSKILRRQYPTGAFPLSVGFRDHWNPEFLPSRPNLFRWRDILPTPNWNAWDFWCLSEILPHGEKLPEPDVRFPWSVTSGKEENDGPYEITEDENRVTLRVSSGGKVVGLYRKRANVADMSLITERDPSWRLGRQLDKYPAKIRRILMALPRIWS